MVSVITSFSRITIIAFIITYTLMDIFLIFERKMSDGLRGVLQIIQSVMIVLFFINSSAVLYLNLEDFSVIAIGILFLLVISLIAYSVNSFRIPASKTLLNNVLMLLSFGIIFLQRLSPSRAVRQFVFVVVSFIIGMILVSILKRLQDFREIKSWLYFYFFVGIVLLIIVLLAGSTEYGAKLSLNIGNISIQPSEFVKISFLFFMASTIVTFKDIRGFIISTIGAVFHVLILVCCKDLGTALIFMMTYLFLSFIAYKNYIVLILEFLVATVGGVMAYNLFPHIQTRFIAWSDPLSVVDNQGYQISQSLFAIGTGGWLGSGLCNGLPTKIPVVTKDFIFAAISEEMGAIVALCLILIFICTFINIFNVAFECTDSFYMLIINGIGVVFAVQTFLNIGGVTKFIPSTGVTLPFISYGGSSLLSMFLCFYIVESGLDLSRGLK